jgi:hypothetical protein
LANFLTYDGSFCFHEGLLQVASPYHIKDLFESTGKEIVGNSDCGNIFFYNELKELYPNAVFIHIKRNIVDVLDELGEMSEDFHDFNTVHMADKLLKELDVVSYRYEELDEQACREIWELCVGTKFDQARWEMLDGTDMSIIEEKKMKQIIRFEKNAIQHSKEFH